MKQPTAILALIAVLSLSGCSAADTGEAPALGFGVTDAPAVTTPAEPSWEPPSTEGASEEQLAAAKTAEKAINQALTVDSSAVGQLGRDKLRQREVDFSPVESAYDRDSLSISSESEQAWFILWAASLQDPNGGATTVHVDPLKVYQDGTSWEIPTGVALTLLVDGSPVATPEYPKMSYHDGKIGTNFMYGFGNSDGYERIRSWFYATYGE